jgi:uncharacterized Zn-binding protein involved in type VI secretion
MGMPAARIGGVHTYSMATGLVPHIGGSVLSPCTVTELTRSLAQARVTHLCACVSQP